MENYKKVEVTNRDFEDTYKFTDNLSKKGPKK